MRILVIEDNHRLNSSLQMNLAHEGYSVDTAYDGQEGQDLAELTPYDLIILDILLPKKDGLEVCRDLRRRLNLKRRDEFGELAATFDQMLGRLDAAFKRQARFTADASHELRTPLTIINLEINQALTQVSTLEEYRQVLEVIQTENKQMADVVNSLLLLARADTGQIDLHLQEVDLSDIALASVERLLPLARQNGITLATGDLPELFVNGDQQYLSMMMMNLVENAIKYSNGIGKRVHVELAAKGGNGVSRACRTTDPVSRRSTFPTFLTVSIA